MTRVDAYREMEKSLCRSPLRVSTKKYSGVHRASARYSISLFTSHIYFHLELESPVTGSGQRSRSAPRCALKKLALGYHYLQADYPLVLVYIYSSAFLLEGHGWGEGQDCQESMRAIELLK